MAYPDATTTGVPAGKVLTKSGSITVTKAGTVIDGLLITGTVTVSADNVVIKNTRIMNTGSIPIRNNGANLTVMDTEINGQGKGNPAVAYNKYTLLRVNIWNVAEGPRISGSNVTIQDSFIHNLVQVGSNHTDVIQSTGGSNIVLRHNTLLVYNPISGMKGNASFQFGEENSVIRSCLVENNYMDGGNYTVNGGGGGTTGAACTFNNNKFGHNFRYGIKAHVGSNSVWAGTNGYL
ncbi:MAG: hypothetical protein ACOH2F_21270 [Cellulomonas sp.]